MLESSDQFIRRGGSVELREVCAKNSVREVTAGWHLVQHMVEFNHRQRSQPIAATVRQTLPQRMATALVTRFANLARLPNLGHASDRCQQDLQTAAFTLPSFRLTMYHRNRGHRLPCASPLSPLAQHASLHRQNQSVPELFPTSSSS